MKNQLSLITLSACALLFSSALPAQPDSKVIVNVPFDFTVMNEQFAAGAYTVTTNLTQSTIVIRGEDQRPMTALTFAASPSKGDDRAKLIFHRYGDRYILSQVWDGESGRELLVSKLERELAKNNEHPKVVALVASQRKHQ